MFLKRILERPWLSIRAFLDRIDGRHQTGRIVDLQGLQQFLESRASHVTQTSLYGYLRTRAGSRYPELFANDDFASAINAAKWNIWLACVSDLAIYAGGMLARSRVDGEAGVSRVMCAVIDSILAAGAPAEADRNYPALADALSARVRGCSWNAVPTDIEAVFLESPAALVRWAPIVDQLKQLDADIVRNSVRFRWQEVRQELRQALDTEALLATSAL